MKRSVVNGALALGLASAMIALGLPAEAGGGKGRHGRSGGSYRSHSGHSRGGGRSAVRASGRSSHGRAHRSYQRMGGRSSKRHVSRGQGVRARSSTRHGSRGHSSAPSRSHGSRAHVSHSRTSSGHASRVDASQARGSRRHASYGRGSYGHGTYHNGSGARRSGGHGHDHGYHVNYGYGYPYYGRYYYYPYYYGYPYYGYSHYHFGYYGGPYVVVGGYSSGSYEPVYGSEASGTVPGSVETDVRPKDAEVLLDGRPIGRARDFNGPFDLLYVEPGSHTIEFAAPGYMTLRVSLAIQPGGYYLIDERLAEGQGLDPRSSEELLAPAEVGVPQTKEPATSLEASYEAPRGTLRQGLLQIRATPPDAVVYLDGEFLARGDELSRLHGALPVARGEHVIEVIRPGYRGETRTILVEGDEPVRIVVDLQRND